MAILDLISTMTQKILYNINFEKYLKIFLEDWKLTVG